MLFEINVVKEKLKKKIVLRLENKYHIYLFICRYLTYNYIRLKFRLDIDIEHFCFLKHGWSFSQNLLSTLTKIM